MPLIHSKKQSAIGPNIKTEMEHGKPQKQSIAIAYNTQRQAKKKKSGGMIRKYADGGEATKGNETSIWENIKNTVASSMDDPEPKPDSKSTTPGHKSMQDTATEGYRKGGMVLTPKQMPRMTESPIIKAKAMTPKDWFNQSEETQSQHPDNLEEDNDQIKPSDAEIMANHVKQLAKGGLINDHFSMKSAEEDMEEHPPVLEEDNDQLRLNMDEYMGNHAEMLAHGGDIEDTPHDLQSRPDRGWGAIIVRPVATGGGKPSAPMADGGMIDDESDIEDDASLAAAAMYKKRMAEGGQVDLKENSMEQPNKYYSLNEDEVLKENYDQDMDDADQPLDSNEHDPEHQEMDDADESIIKSIRRKMKPSPITR